MILRFVLGTILCIGIEALASEDGSCEKHFLVGAESEAMQWLAAGRSMDELDDKTLQRYIDAVGGVKQWNELIVISLNLDVDSDN